MTEKELKKLNRYQLLELLVTQTERADRLQKKVDELEKKLREHELSFSELGSVAEAAVKISGVLEAAQEAADLYLESAKKQVKTMLESANREAASIIAQAKETSDCDLSGLQVNADIATGKRNADGI